MGGSSWQTGGAVVYIFVYTKSVCLGGSCHKILELLSSARVVDSSHQLAWATDVLLQYLLSFLLY